MIGFLRVVPAGRSSGGGRDRRATAVRLLGDRTTWPTDGNSWYGAPDDNFLVAQPNQDLQWSLRLFVHKTIFEVGNRNKQFSEISLNLLQYWELIEKKIECVGILYNEGIKLCFMIMTILFTRRLLEK